MEVHAGVLDTSGPVPEVTKESKTEVLFASAPLHTYTDASTFDGANLSHVLLPGDRYLPIVEQFPYLGDIVSRDGGDAAAVNSRINAAGKAFGALRKCIFATTSVSLPAKRAVYAVNRYTFFVKTFENLAGQHLKLIVTINILDSPACPTTFSIEFRVHGMPPRQRAHAVRSGGHSDAVIIRKACTDLAQIGNKVSKRPYVSAYVPMS